MINFRQWLEEKDWLDFHRSRGKNTDGHMGVVGNTMLPPAHSDVNVQFNMNHSDMSNIELNLQMLHDRIMDSAEISTKDLELFVKYLTANIPGDPDDILLDRVKHSWDNAIPKVRGGLETYNAWNLQYLLGAMKVSAQIAKRETPDGDYFRKFLPMLRNIVRHIQTKAFRGMVNIVRNHRRGMNAWVRNNPY